MKGRVEVFTRVGKRAITRWAAETLDARAVLPALIRRLVHATTPTLRRIDFPAFESSERSGFDGEIECELGNAWVPQGNSKWELSVEKKPKGKATSDYQLKTQKTPELARRSSTYVALTAQHWDQKAAWRQEISDLREWHEVRAYDADDIEQWLERPLAVAIWFSSILEIQSGEIYDHAVAWRQLASSTLPSLSARAFLVSRERSQARLNEWISESPSYLQVVSPFPSDANDFICAAVQALDEVDREALSSQLVYVESRRAFRGLRQHAAPLTIVVDHRVPLRPVDIAEAIENQMRVVQGRPPFEPVPDAAIRLERVRQHELSEELKTCGLTQAESDQRAKGCGGSTTLLKSAMARFASGSQAFSILESERGSIRAAMLLGGWDGRNPYDRAVVERLAAKPYDDVELDCRKWSQSPEPLTFTAEGKWRLISKADAWQRGAIHLALSAYEMFVPISVQILTNTLSDDNGSEHPYGQTYLGEVGANYSDTLKLHLCETLAFFGAFGNRVIQNDERNLQLVAARIVSDVTHAANTTVWWASMRSKLSHLAEAAPIAYLSALEMDLKNQSPAIAGLFNPAASHPLLSGCDYAGLLWSLETLAWSPKYLPRVCSILLRLHNYHVPSNYANKPIASLAQIVSCAIPCTTATVEVRIEVIRRLVKENEDNAWALLMELLDHFRGFGLPLTNRPDWQDWASEWQLGARNQDIHIQLEAVCQLVLAIAGNSARRWSDVMDHLTTMPQEFIRDAISKLEAFPLDTIADPDRQLLCDRLNDFVGLHQDYAATSKKLTTDDLVKLAAVADALKPKSLALRHAWLFNRWVDRHLLLGDDTEAAERDLVSERAAAIREILAEESIEGVINLARESAHPFEVGRMLAELTADEYTSALIPNLISEELWSINFVAGFANRRHTSGNIGWIAHQLSRCGAAKQRAWLLVSLPVVEDSWDLVDADAAEVKTLYWSRVMHYGIANDITSVDRGVRELIQVGRLAHAVDVVCSAIQNKLELSTDLILLPLEAFLSAPLDIAQAQRKQLSNYEVGKLMKHAQQLSNIAESRLVALELYFLNMLDEEQCLGPVTLSRTLSRDPECFVNLLTVVYRSRNGEDNEADEVELSGQRVEPRAAGELLYRWKAIPGLDENGAIDFDTLHSWVEQARRNANERGYAEVCDRRIGELFASPSEAGGTWPCEEICRIMERIGTDDIAAGFYFAVINSRGVVCRGEGGEQERELAERYGQLADQVRTKSTFVADVLDSISRYYIREGKEWDSSEEWER